MFFSSYRRIKRLGKHLLLGSSLISSPVIVAGVVGVIGLAALIYLKKKADEKSGDKDRGFNDFTEIRYGKRPCRGGRSPKKHQVYREEDFIVDEVVEATPAEKKSSAKKTAPKKSADKPVRAKVSADGIWIASVTSKTFHKPDCSSVKRISEKNRIELKGSKASLVRKGYKPCSACMGE